jgi:hypothetical protein
MNTARRLHVRMAGSNNGFITVVKTLDAAESVIPTLPDPEVIKKTARSEKEV